MSKKVLTARITHLEMNSRPSKNIPFPSKPKIALLQSEKMPVHFYRYLYEHVGKAHHWYERRKIDDAALLDIIHNENTIIEVLYANGAPAGFFELEEKRDSGQVELVYFGLLPDFQGLGLGKWFLYTAIQRAWDCSPDKVTVHTNTLDHPAALALYQKMGFSPCGISEESVTVWE